MGKTANYQLSKSNTSQAIGFLVNIEWSAAQKWAGPNVRFNKITGNGAGPCLNIERAPQTTTEDHEEPESARHMMATAMVNRWIDEDHELEELKESRTVYVDCWTSGNPGVGGYRVVNSARNVLVERNWNTINTNNYYELAAIGAGIKHLNGPGILYSDSGTAISWVNNGSPSKDFIKSKDTVYATEIQRIITSIRELPNFHIVQIKKISGGENPADYGRKAH